LLLPNRLAGGINSLHGLIAREHPNGTSPVFWLVQLLRDRFQAGHLLFQSRNPLFQRSVRRGAVLLSFGHEPALRLPSHFQGSKSATAIRAWGAARGVTKSVGDRKVRSE